MKKKYLLISLVPIILFSTILFKSNTQAGFLFLILLFLFSILIRISISIGNNLLTSILSLAAIAHVIGAPLFTLNKQDYSYSGWNAVKDFDFSSIYFFNIYTYSISALLLLVLFVHLFEKFNNKADNTDIQIEFSEDVKVMNTDVWSLFFFILLIFSLAIAVFMYVNKIAILGIESERLPFRLVGILFYFRGYGLPILLFIVYRKTLQSKIITFLYLIVALIVGALSASRGVTFIYMFPILIGLLSNNISIKKIIQVVLLILLGYFTTSLTRDVMYSSSNISIFDLPILLFNSNSSFQSDDGILYSLLSIISTISNRLYGAQDSVLAYQHVLNDPWNSFYHFILSGTIVEDLAGELYGLVFLPGMGYGVGLGLIGLLVMIGRASIFLLFFGTLFFSILIVLTNSVLKKIFKKNTAGKYPHLYYLFLFIAGFNFLQATMAYIYFILVVSSLFILIKYISFNYTKIFKF